MRLEDVDSFRLNKHVLISKLALKFILVKTLGFYKKSNCIPSDFSKNSRICLEFRIRFQALHFLGVVVSHLNFVIISLAYFCNFYCGVHPCSKSPAGEVNPLLQQTHHPLHHLGGGLLATMVVHSHHYWFLSTPLLVGIMY